MASDFTNIDPNRFAAVVYRPQDDVDTLLSEFARDLQRSGRRLGGIVQVNGKDADGHKADMRVLDLASGEQISLWQSLGSGAASCKLDPAGLAEAAVAVSRAIAQDLDLIVINKFSKQEAAGKGLRSEFAEAIMSAVPVLTAVPEASLQAWVEFTGDRGTTLLCARAVVDDWWRDLSRRLANAAAMEDAA
jgi:molybdate transport system ATP-binding protein